jgi:hypothetical protein
MGTSLTGLTPATTYDALIKVGDNGPLSATAKYLSDGLGNDSVLALSTGFVGIGTTSAVGSRMELAIGGNAAGSAIQLGRGGTNKATIQLDSGDVLSIENNGAFPISFATNAAERMRITSAGNVGIGTSSPSTTLHLDASGGATIRLQRTSSSANRFDVGTDGTNMEFNVRDTGNFTFGGTGSYLRLASGTGGIQFNGDTAAANALDDYEEGTFTPAMDFGGGSVGVTYFDRQGNYTKIGRQVTCTIYLALTSKGSSTGTASITNLPFTSSNLNRGMASVGSIRFDNITYTGMLIINLSQNSQSISFLQTTEAGSDSLLTDTNFNGSSEMTVTITYFV